MRKIAIVLALALVGLVTGTACAERYRAGRILEATNGGEVRIFYCSGPVEFDRNYLSPNVRIRNIGTQSGGYVRADAQWVSGNLISYLPAHWMAGGGYYYQQPAYGPVPQPYYPQPQPAYPPQYYPPQQQYYPQPQQQQPVVIYNPPANPYAGYLEGIFIGAVGNVIEGAGAGAADRVYDEIARGGRRYRGHR